MRKARFSPSCFLIVMETRIKIKIKQSPPVSCSASSSWPSSAYFPLTLFRLVSPVWDETVETEQCFENVLNFPKDVEPGSSHSSYSPTELLWVDWCYKLDQDEKKRTMAEISTKYLNVCSPFDSEVLIQLSCSESQKMSLVLAGAVSESSSLDKPLFHNWRSPLFMNSFHLLSDYEGNAMKQY